MPLKQAISEAPRFGAWLASGSAVIAELASLCGVDWILFDMEHGATCEADLLGSLQAAKSASVQLVVRVPTHDPGLIGRVLDRGVDAVMVPHVETAEQASQLVRAMRYAPEGSRGYSRSARVYGYGVTPVEQAPKGHLFAQIESFRGLCNVEEIASVSGVDVLFVGPADLRLSLACESNAPDYNDALKRIATAAAGSGIGLGILMRARHDLPILRSLGFRHIAVDSDLATLRASFLEIAQLKNL